jgi:hypothetical protein
MIQSLRPQYWGEKQNGIKIYIFHLERFSFSGDCVSGDLGP